MFISTSYLHDAFTSTSLLLPRHFPSPLLYVTAFCVFSGTADIRHAAAPAELDSGVKY